MWDASELVEAIARDTAAESDRHLVERTLAGDSEAFARLHKRYYARVYRIALFRTRSVQDAEDIASETFVRAISHLRTYRFQGESIFPWLSRIASNLIADQGRRAAGVTMLSLDGGGSEGVRALIEGLPGDAPDPHTLAERQETQAVLRAAIAKLAPDQAEAVLLRFGADLPLKDIAEAMGKTEGAIKSLLHRALVNLRRSLVLTEDQTREASLRHRQYGEQYNSDAERLRREGRQTKTNREHRHGDNGTRDP